MGTTEQWKVIEGYDSYEVSNTGKVRSKRKGSLLKLLDNGKGYYKAQLYYEGKAQKEYVHRLVASAFIPNPTNKLYVNHIDNNPSNNDVSNLEWCTHQENMEWMKKQGRNKRTQKWLEHLHLAQSKEYRAVIGKNIETGQIIRFEKLNDVKKAGFQPSCVCCCCNGTRNVTQHKGYRWEYA